MTTQSISLVIQFSLLNDFNHRFAKPFISGFLILHEITNNLDLETKDHVIQVLKAFPGAMIIISHDADFLEEIGVNSYFKITDGYVSFSAR